YVVPPSVCVSAAATSRRKPATPWNAVGDVTGCPSSVSASPGTFVRSVTAVTFGRTVSRVVVSSPPASRTVSVTRYATSASVYGPTVDGVNAALRAPETSGTNGRTAGDPDAMLVTYSTFQVYCDFASTPWSGSVASASNTTGRPVMNLPPTS